jgi:hypothetical protein
LYNRGYYGTSHGWGIAHSVAWNCDVGNRTLIVQRPPTGQNYAIGCTGVVTGVKPPAPFLEPEGFIEGANRPGLVPVSLYRAQLHDRLGIPVSVGRNETAPLPEKIRLMHAFPNPFNGSTSIAFTLPASQNVRISIVDLLGREVAVLSDEKTDAGVHRVSWEAGAHASGVYVCRLQAGQSVQTAKIMHLR